ncbi:MAG: DNA polymerase III subunit beta [Acidobacteriota bacterium]
MDLTLNRAALLDELQLIQGIVERRTTIPILANVLLMAEGDRLSLAATDLDVTVYTRCPAVVREEGRATIHSRVFFDLVRSLPADTVDITCRENRVEVRSGPFESQLASLDPSDFPTLPEAPSGQGFSLPLPLLHSLIDRTAFAVSAEEGHFQYNAALLLVSAKNVEMVATDGHRLAYVKAAQSGQSAPFDQQLLPRKVLGLLRRLAPEDDTPVYLARGENHLAFRLGERVLLSRLLEARFPQYERVLVRDNPNRALVQRHDLAASLRRVALLTSERTHGVQMNFESDAISLASVGFDLGQATEVVPCRYDGEPLKVFVNAQYVLDFLGAVEATEIEMRLRDSDGPVVLSPVGDETPISESLYVIMPIRL